MTHPRARTLSILRRSLPLFAALASTTLPALATDFTGVLPAALDQPQINFHLRPNATSDPWIGDGIDEELNPIKAFNLSAFLDTGASGVLISGDFTTTMYRPPNGAVGIPDQLYQNKPVLFEDVGVSGSDRFGVSAPLHVSLAPYHPNTDVKVQQAESDLTQNNSFTGIDLSFYNQKYGNIRAQVSAPSDPDNPQPLDGINVIGMPVMTGKTVVMDMRAANKLQFDTMRTYIYNPGTPYKPATNDTDPGIPNTTRRIKLSYASFDSFTKSGTLNNDGVTLDALSGQTLLDNQPTLAHNPFIGPNPLIPGDTSAPPITVSFQSNPNDPTTLRSANGSFLLDTGAAASMISRNLAGQLAVRYRADAPADDPKLETFDPAHPTDAGTLISDQFQLQIGGVGGTSTVAGFYLKSLLVRTMEGNANYDNDPKHFRFLDAPVLVSDITLSPTKTLDGIFGMNFLADTALIELVDLGGLGKFPIPVGFAPGAFDYVVFDETSGQLKVRPRIPGDANRDGVVDFNDLVALAQHFNGDTDPEDYWGGGDFNGDDVVDFNDLVALAQHYNLTDINDGDRIDLPFAPFDIGFGSPVGASAPEPASLGVLVAAAAPLLFRRRRRA